MEPLVIGITFFNMWLTEHNHWQGLQKQHNEIEEFKQRFDNMKGLVESDIIRHTNK